MGAAESYVVHLSIRAQAYARSSPHVILCYAIGRHIIVKVGAWDAPPHQVPHQETERSAPNYRAALGLSDRIRTGTALFPDLITN